MRATGPESTVSAERIATAILIVRGHKVMIDRDLAGLYGVSVKALNQAVRRNLDRFPGDFMFQLTWEEARSVRSQPVTLKPERGALPSSRIVMKRGAHPKYLPLAFTS